MRDHTFLPYTSGTMLSLFKGVANASRNLTYETAVPYNNSYSHYTTSLNFYC